MPDGGPDGVTWQVLRYGIDEVLMMSRIWTNAVLPALSEYRQQQQQQQQQQPPPLLGQCNPVGEGSLVDKVGTTSCKRLAAPGLQSTRDAALWRVAARHQLAQVPGAQHQLAQVPGAQHQLAQVPGARAAIRACTLMHACVYVCMYVCLFVRVHVHVCKGFRGSGRYLASQSKQGDGLFCCLTHMCKCTAWLPR